MKKATFVTAIYEESNTITPQGNRSSIQQYLNRGYNIVRCRNGFWVLNKPSLIYVYLKNDDNITLSFNMKSDILKYYNKERISQSLFKKFVSDATSGKIQFYMDNNGYYCFE